MLIWTPIKGINWLAPEPARKCEVCYKMRGIVKCNGSLDKEYKKHNVPEEYQTFRSCGKLCC